MFCMCDMTHSYMCCKVGFECEDWRIHFGSWGIHVCVVNWVRRWEKFRKDRRYCGLEWKKDRWGESKVLDGRRWVFHICVVRVTWLIHICVLKMGVESFIYVCATKGEENMEHNFYHLFFPHLFCNANKHILLCVIQLALPTSPWVCERESERERE